MNVDFKFSRKPEKAKIKAALEEMDRTFGSRENVMKTLLATFIRFSLVGMEEEKMLDQAKNIGDLCELWQHHRQWVRDGGFIKLLVKEEKEKTKK